VVFRVSFLAVFPTFSKLRGVAPVIYICEGFARNK
jgi:hypothetical protein